MRPAPAGRRGPAGRGRPPQAAARRAGLEDGGIPARVIDELMGHQASRSQGRSGSTIGLRYRHMTPAMQARIVAVIDRNLAAAKKVLGSPR